MKMKSIYVLSIIVALCLMLNFQAIAQYKITKSVIGSGGGKIANSNNQINSTIGQPIIGFTGDAISQYRLGFWSSSGKISILAKNSPYPLHMPFQPGTTWQVGGSGYFYGESGHSNAN
ncbi:MAG: hypothetical protein ONB05_07630, partial [candidate division KSB1 bacterium]|nr:hypothetical protein [candidate division KSB1 bacterium]